MNTAIVQQHGMPWRARLLPSRNSNKASHIADNHQGCRISTTHDADWQHMLPDPERSVSWREVDPGKEV
ncbi:MAG TPA: hypothetical protein PLN21_17600 [Gemmatales bacterium]|nr:hypothetical protein [Gemmatales bacterium]